MKYEQLIKKLRAGDKFRNAIYPPTNKELQAASAIEELLDCVSTKEYATIHGVSPERVKVLCREKRICGARKGQRGKSCVNSIKMGLLGENYGRNNFYQGDFST